MKSNISLAKDEKEGLLGHDVKTNFPFNVKKRFARTKSQRFRVHIHIDIAK